MASIQFDGGQAYVEGVSDRTKHEKPSFELAFDDAVKQVERDEDLKKRAVRTSDGYIHLHVIEMYVRVENPVHDYRVVLGVDT